MPNSEQDQENFIILVFSGLGTALGVITILCYASDAFYGFNFWFFFVSFVFMIYCLYIDKKSRNYIAPRSLLFNPHFHNIITFASFAFTGTTSILYIFDTTILHIDLLGTFIENKEIQKTIRGITSSKEMSKILMYVEIFILPELFLRLLIRRSLATLFVFIIYIVFISMFSYALSIENRSVWVKAYNYFKKQVKSTQGNTKQMFILLCQFSDFISSTSLQIYPSSKFY